MLAAMAGAERIFDMMEECEEVDNGKVTLTRVRSVSRWQYAGMSGIYRTLGMATST